MTQEVQDIYMPVYLVKDSAADCPSRNAEGLRRSLGLAVTDIQILQRRQVAWK